MKLSGRSLIAGRAVEGSGPAFRAVRPDSGEPFEPVYRSVDSADLDRAVQSAHEAFQTYGHATGRTRGAFLRAVAQRLDAMVEDFVLRTPQETGLPEARIRSECARTTGQLRLFAQLVEEGSWVDARIDHGDPSRKPAPKPDMRSMLRPTGPVAVFGAANFPLAFSVAGGDTASALAAGCPVIVKAHPAHPGTSELAGLAIAGAVQECGLPAGVFSLLFDAGYDVGRKLVAHPLVTAVAFTGSRAGGLALAHVAAARPDPIPVFAEMSSTNPVFLLPGALKTRAADIAEKLQASVNVGVGQLCTSPGLVIAERSATLDEWIRNFTERMAATPPGVMLNAGVAGAFSQGLAQLSEKSSVQRLTPENSGASVWRTTSRAFLGDSTLATEVFGPSTLIVECEHRDAMLQVARSIEGQLTATVHAEESDRADTAELVRALEQKAGRVILNSVPTGLEVGPATVHGGPFPATSDGRTTSVGTRALLRFARLVCYQGFPNDLLPEELREENPLGICRMVDGETIVPR